MMKDQVIGLENDEKKIQSLLVKKSKDEFDPNNHKT